jgi:hypothetical protein
MITPKAPVMVLNEMVGSVSYSFVEPPTMPGSVPTNIFMAQCEVYGTVFTGTGPSKQVHSLARAE